MVERETIFLGLLSKQSGLGVVELDRDRCHIRTPRHQLVANNITEIISLFIDFVASEEGQKIIREYGKEQYGEGLYNDAAYAHQYDD